MIIVSGQVKVDPQQRATYLEDCRQVIQLARQTSGCIDFSLSADLLAEDRINVYEQWETVADVEAFRGSGPAPGQADLIRDAAVFQHEVASSVRL